ncbi:WSC-domain-containing protein [Trematosphaeria pertusa]|uniref:WSC-domain-containing protein n=1 Tax=Trematosphaeria pertusa TaxID=390896 RepID=A0A6A6IL36_9PLEO|nr:WSC-domain-containing protein [Trematosphaeria pertusa]KAF2251106.1 WSC-domain-containing protein [Trematosphaeria pertusa]
MSPGSVSGHVHFISGGSAFNASMVYDDMRKAKCSSCTCIWRLSTRLDMSNYWTPQLNVHLRNGSFAPVPTRSDSDDHGLGMTVYYFQRYGDGEKLRAFPPGFRMVAGDPDKRNFTGDLSARAVTYYCAGGGLANDTWGLPDVNCPDYLRVMLFMPSCWNGKDVAPPMGESHVSYPVDEPGNGKCPPDFPVHLPTLFYEVEYDTGRFKEEWVDGKQPFVFANGDATGYGFHGDFINGWDVDVLQEAVDTCTTDPGGTVEGCSVLDQFTAEECLACKLPSIVSEDVNGPLPSLPGCNPVTNGSGPANPVSDCPDTAKLGPFAPNYVDLTTTKQWSYIGCGTDNYFTRALTENHTASTSMTVETCVDYCASAGYTHAGLEFGQECWCGNELKADNAPKEGYLGSCTMKCAGNTTQLCGAASAISLYRKCASDDAQRACKNYQFGGAPSLEEPPPSLPQTIPASSSTAAPPTAMETSSTTTPTPTAALACPHNNCINQIFDPTASVSASTFCASYTQSVNTDPSAIPGYLNNCQGKPEEVSSACCCLAHPTAYMGA